MPYIQIDNLEVPIVDGSGAPFMQADPGSGHQDATAAAGAICAFVVRFRWKPPANASRFCRRTAFC